MDIYSALWLLMSWCFSTRTSVATVLIMCPWISICLWIKSCIYVSLSEKELTLLVLTRNIPGELGQYHGCWCPGSLCCQAINSHGVPDVECRGPCLSVFNNLCHLYVEKWYKKTYIFLFPTTHLEHHRLTHCGLVMPYGGRDLGQHWFR